MTNQDNVLSVPAIDLHTATGYVKHNGKKVLATKFIDALVRTIELQEAQLTTAQQEIERLRGDRDIANLRYQNMVDQVARLTAIGAPFPPTVATLQTQLEKLTADNAAVIQDANQLHGKLQAKVELWMDDNGDYTQVVRWANIDPLFDNLLDPSRPGSALLERMERLEGALGTAQQALLEVKTARDNGPNWFTKGVTGQQSHIETWLRKGLTATRQALEGE